MLSYTDVTKLYYFKGAAHWYYFDVKQFSLTACFIMKSDVKCYDYTHQNGGPCTTVYNNAQALATF